MGVEAPVGADHDFAVLLIAYRKIEDELSERAETQVTLISNIANSMTEDTGAADCGSQD